MNEACAIQIKGLSVADLSEIVRVHAASFPRSATTRLGAGTVRRYYEWQFIGPHDAHYPGAWCGEQLGGFCFCGLFRGALSGFLGRHWWYLGSQVLSHPWLCIDPQVRSAVVSGLGALRPFSPPPLTTSPRLEQAGRHFGILSIAVDPRCRRLGVGARLMHEAEKIALQRGFQMMGLTVEPCNEPAVHFYEKLGWKRINRNGAWEGRMEKLIGNSSNSVGG